MRTYLDFSSIIEKTFCKVFQKGETINFVCADTGVTYTMEHEQFCCENVFVESIIGDLSDLEDTPITFADESSANDPAASESGTWTFYKLATRKGWVDIRWHGSSNGYYNESVSFFCK